MNDFHLLKGDYHTLSELCLSHSLKRDIDSLTRLLIECNSTGEIPPRVIFDEIVLKTIHRIKNLGRQQKLNGEIEEVAINAALESFGRLKRALRTSN